MYCPKCGKQIAQESRFCAACGTENPNCSGNVPTTMNVVEVPKKKSSVKKIVLIVVAIVSVLLIYYLITMPRVDLKYDWGTDYNTIDDKETVVSRIDPGDQVFGLTATYNEYVLKCSDKPGNIDGLDELASHNRVEYTFDPFEMKLVSIQYEHNMPDEVDKRIEIMEDIYGSDYFISDFARIATKDIGSGMQCCPKCAAEINKEEWRK